MTREFTDHINRVITKEMEDYITRLENSNMAMVDILKETGLSEEEIKDKLKERFEDLKILKSKN